MTATFDPILPDGDLPPELAAFARGIRAFAERELAPHARAVDEERRFRRETVTALAAAGVIGGPLPESAGGGGWSARQLAIAHEEIGAVCGNARGFLAVQTGLVAQCLLQHADRAQRERWLPGLLDGSRIGCFGLTEPDAGSDVASLACRAERTAAGTWRLTGRKIWITNAGVADIAIVFATVDPSRGRDGITGFLVETDRPGLAREPMPGVELGHRGSDHAQLVLDGVEVPDAAVLGGLHHGFRVAMDGLHAGRLSVAAGATGIHRAALDCARRFAAERVQFGKPIARLQMVQERLADMAIELLASRALVARCADRRDAGREVPGDLAAAKLYATEAAARAAEHAILLLGGRGYSSAWPAERLWRDAMGLRIYEGTSLIQRAIVARALTD
ncbi:MAG: acyl-CoA dehydrogenase family protein [Planctomycetes bacterium]|nr:acyl-CoA dehydrogenase family protein [Planctomycetota bacterium]